MMDEPKKSKRGGARPGAGRKRKNPDAQTSPLKRTRRPKTSSAPGEAAHAHEWLKSTLEGSAEGVEAQARAPEPAAEEQRSAIGRPSGYKPEYAEQAEKLCRLGATDPEIADFFGVDARTIYRWKHAHEAFCRAIKAGKDFANERVERSLYQRAIGYQVEAVKIFMPAGASEPVYAKYIENVPPDTTAQIFWLKNRRPDLWRDKHDLNVTSDGLAAMLDQARKRAAEIEASLH